MAQLSGQARREQPRGGRTVRATSCGGIVLRERDGEREIVLGRLERNTDGAVLTWALPKGTPAEGESSDRTALREVAEETGLEVRIVAPVGAIEYFFTRQGRRIHKTVHYFLMESIGGSLERHDHEFDEVRWVPLDEALRLMIHPTERQIVEQALEMAALSDAAAG